MKTIIFLSSVMLWPLLVCGEVNNTTSECEARISIALKDAVKVVRTNEPTVLVIKISNTSTNEVLLFEENELPSDYSWKVISPSGKNISPKLEKPKDVFSSVFQKISPLESTEREYDVNKICDFNEVGTYKITVNKEVFRLHPKREKWNITSEPLELVISK